MTRTVAIAVSDLLFQSRIRAAVEALGLEPCVADSEPAFDEALRRTPALVVVDLQERGVEPVRVIERARETGARVLAYGRHTDPATLRAARERGADAVVPRSQLAEELPRLIEALAGARPAGDAA